MFLRTIQRAGRALRNAIQLPVSPDSPARARQFVRSELTHQPEEVVEVAELLTSELVTNAIIHGQSAVELELELELEIDTAAVKVAIIDQGLGSPILQNPTEVDRHGRGLQIVRGLADDWGVTWRERGKCVWFTLRTASEPNPSV